MANTNTMTAATTTILAMALRTLRGFCTLPRLINTDYGRDAQQIGNTVQVPIHSRITPNAVSPSNTAPDDTGVTPTSASIALSNWYESPFFLSDKDLADAGRGFAPGQVVEAARGIAEQINESIFDKYLRVYGYTGTAATTPFGTADDISDATNLRKLLNSQVAPMAPRSAVLDVDAAANALGQRAFSDASWRGDDDGIVEGMIGRKLGFNWYEDQQVPTHTAGTITTGLVAKASTAQPIGDKTIVCTTAASTGACALKEGDIISFNGHDQTYVVTADATEASASTDVTVNIEPGLVVALAGSEAVTVRASHVVNLGFHRDAFALAMRPLDTPESFTGGNIIQSMVDPVSGLTLRLEVERQHKRTRWAIDALWGVELVRPELAARLAG